MNIDEDGMNIDEDASNKDRQLVSQLLSEARTERTQSKSVFSSTICI